MIFGLYQAGGDVGALKKVEVAGNAVAKDAVEKEADVIVVDAGGAGLASAVSAAEEGASVIVIEKNPYIGGNTFVQAAVMFPVTRKLSQFTK